jgi:hypothetical protein
LAIKAKGEEKNSYLESAVTLDKSRFGRIKPSKSKPFYLDGLGWAWIGLAGLGVGIGAPQAIGNRFATGNGAAPSDGAKA